MGLEKLQTSYHEAQAKWNMVSTAWKHYVYTEHYLLSVDEHKEWAKWEADGDPRIMMKTTLNRQLVILNRKQG